MQKFLRADRHNAGGRQRASLVTLCVSAMLAFGVTNAQAQAQRGFTNLGFELPSAGASVCSFQIDAAQVPGWLTTHPSAGGNACAPNIPATTGPLIEIWSNNFNGIAARQGTQFAELNAQQASRLYQNVCMVSGETVSWIFSHRGRQSATVGDVTEFRIGNTAGTNRVVRALDSNDGNPGAATCFANDGSVTANTCTRVTTAGWGDYSGSFVWTGAPGVQQIGFEAISSAGGDNSLGNFVDNVQVVLQPFVELAGNSTLTEGGALTPPQIRVVGTVPAGGMNVQVVLTGTATLTSDYTTASGTTTVTIAVPAGFYDGTTAASQFDVPITGIVNDAVIENNETVVMTVQPSASYLIASTAACGGVPNTTATLTIVDNDIDLATTKTVNNPTPTLGSTVQYTVAYTNRTARPTIAPLIAHDALATVADAVPAGLTFTSWTCTASNGASCPGGAVNGTTSGSGAISGNASLPAGNAAAGGAVSYVVNATVGTCGSGILNTSTVTDPAGFAEGTSVQAGFTSPAPGGVANNTASVSVLAPCPQLTVSKTASPNPFTVGQPANYTITVQNTGSSTTVGNIVVADTLPTGITLASAGGANWSCAGISALSCTFTGTLAPSASTILTLNVVVGASAISGNNSAVASGGGDSSCPAAAHCTGTVTVAVNASADLNITKTDGSATAMPGNSIVYTVTASNAGPSAANGATIADTLPAAISAATWTAAYAGGATGPASGSGSINATVNLLAGGSATFTVTGTISASATGTLSNTATVAAPAGVTDPTPGNNSSTDTDTLTPQANLGVTKTDGNASAIPGGAISYTIVATNAGPSTATGAVVADSIPASITGATWTAVYAGGATGPVGGSGNINATVNIPVGGSATFTVAGTVSATATGTLANTATIAPPAGTTDPTPGNNSSTDTDTLTPQANLGITKTDGSASATPGSAISYTIVASNAGPSIATGALVTDTIPATITGATWTAVYVGGATGPASGTGNISATVNIPVGGTATFTVTGALSATATGTLANTATITPPTGTIDPTPGDNTATDTDTLNASANLAITKTDGSATYTPGNAISYTIVASNAGPSIATGAVVTDTIPAAITGVTWTAVYAGGATGPASGAGNISATVNVPVSGTATFTVTGTVSASATGSLTNTASIATPTGTTDPTPANNSATDSDTAVLSSDISTVKTGTTSAAFGGALTYSVIVSNNGPSNANGTTFSDPLPAGVSGVTASCGSPIGGAVCGAVNVAGTTVTSTITTLPSGGSVTFTINATAPTSGTSITNNATAQPPTGTTDPTPGDNTGTATTTLLQPQLTVTKTATPSAFTVGQPASYAITVSNTGAGPTSGTITLTDALPTGITLASAAGTNWSCAGTTALGCTFTGSIAAGGSTVLTLNVNVAANATTGNNSASASGGGDPTCSVATPPARCTGTVTTTVNTSADIAVTKSVGNPAPNVGENVTFTVTATNNGPNNATGVAITDALPSGLAFVSATPSQGTYVSATGLWTVGAIANGTNATLQIVATVLTPGSITNTATKTAGNQFDPDTGNNAGSAMLNANPSADLQVTKTVNNATPNLGTNVVYTITLTNAGPNDATGVIVDDLLPAGLNFVSAIATLGTYDAGTGLWMVGAVDASTTETLTITATVTLPGDITNTASVDADQNDPNPANNSSGVTLNGQSSDIQVIKGVDNANPVRGNTVTFTITATNNGPSAATGVAITDALPTGLLFVLATPSQGTYAVGTGIWNVGNLAATGAGATATLTIVATVDTDSGFTNTASLTALDQTDPNPANNSSSVVMTPVASANLAITKTDGGTAAVPGDTIAYTIVATNAGPSDVTGATITDIMPATITDATWTAVYAGGATGFASGSGDIDVLVDIPVGGTATITLTGTISATATGTLANTATIEPPTGVTDPTPGDNNSTDTDTLDPAANLAITKTDGSATYTPGTAISYTIVASNAGPSTATGAVVTDTIPAAITGATWTVVYAGSATGPASGTGNISATVDVPVGGTATFTITGTVSANATGVLANTATIVPPTGTTDPTPGNNSATDSDNAAPSANLGITKTDGDAVAISGGPISYTIVATNAGPSTATGAVVTDTIPASITGATWTAVYAGGATGPASGIGSINATVNIPVGGSATFTVTGTISANATGTLANTATVTPPSGTIDPTPDDDTATDTDTLTPSANLAITKTDGSTTYTPGAAISYTIVASNAGPSIATGAIVTDTIPAAITGATWTAAYAGGATGTGNGTGNINATVNIPIGATAIFTVIGTVSANATGALTNTAVIAPPAGTTDPNPSNNSATDSDTATPSANLAITKTDGSASATPGSAISYTIVASNAGPSTATGAVVTDAIPASITGATWTAVYAGGATGPASGTGNVNATVNIPVGSTATFTVAGAISESATGSLANTASIAPPVGTIDPTPDDNTSTDTDTLNPSANLAITKTDGSASATPGSAISYTIVASNAGPSTATGAVVTDTIPATINGATWTAVYTGGATGPVSGTGNINATVNIPVGATVTFTVTGTISAAATGTLANTATITPPTGTTDPTPGDDTSTDTDTLNAQANLAITKTDGSTTYTPGAAISYTIVASNAGPSIATGAVVTDTIPAAITGATWTAVYAGGATGPASGTGNINATVNIAVGATATFMVTGTVNAGATGNLVNTASIAPPAGTTDATPGNNSATDTDTSAASADIASLKTGPASVGLGGALTYTVLVSNNGPSNANGTTFSDPLPAGFTGVTASCGTPTGGAVCGTVNVAGLNVTSTITTLPSGGSVTFTINGTAPLTGTTLSNTATANPPTGTDDPTPDNNASSVSTTLLPAQLTVTKTATPTPFVVGQPAQYTVAVQNTGSGTTNAPITVVDALPTGITLASATGTNWTCTGTTTLSCTFSGTLAPNATATLTLDVNVADSATTANNAATATGGGDPTCSVVTPPAHCTGTVTDPVLASADIAVTKIVDNATPNVGQNVVFTITAANNGPSNATGVAITDALPSGLAFVSATPSQGTFTSATGLWAVGSLVNGTSATLQITAKVLIPGTLTNTATKTAGDQLDPDTSNNSGSASLNAQPSADLQVLKTVDNPVPNLGTNVTFTITVTNAGPNDATGVVISDPLPLGLNFVSATPSQGTYDEATGLWTVGAIAQGASQTLSLVATATLPGDVMNNASVSASGQFDPNPANNSSGAIVNGQSADIQVVKTADNVNPIRGDSVTFTITATNNGPSNATGVAITDALPTGLVFVSSTASQGSYASVTGIWTVGNLAATGASATATLTIVATVDTDSGFTNTAAVSAADQPDPNLANNSSSVVVTPIANSDLSITKTDGSTTAVPGTAVTYTIVASNAGPSTATGATVTDTLPATISAATWTAVYSAGASGPASGAGNINAIVTIPSGGTATFALTGTISATATGTLANTASIAAPAGTTDPTPGNNSAIDTDTLVPTANIGVVKTGPASVVAGSTISYSVVVSNAGPSAANATTFSDAVPASITGVTATCGLPTTGATCGAVNVAGNTVTSAITTLPSGGSVTFTISGTAPVDPTSLSNTAIVTVPTGVTDPDPVDNSSTANTTVSASADLSIVKTGPSTIQSGAPISYTLLIHNAGPSAADGATYSDVVPPGITGVIATCGGATGGAACANPGVSGNTVSGNVPAFPSGGSVTITISGNAPFGTQTLNNTATVIAPIGVADPNAANNSSSASTTIGGAADIALTKTVDNAAPNVGDTVVFTITASNLGPNDASGVAVTDSLPAGLGFVSATQSQGTYTSGSGLWAIGAIANGDAVTLTITATVDQPGSMTNTVAVSAADQPDPDTSNNNAGASVGAGATADIGIAKTADNSAPNVGDTVTYTLTVTNHGPNDATGVEATDHLPTGTTFAGALPSQGTYDNVGGVWVIGAIANGASATLTITVSVDAPGSITNTATLTHEDQFDPVGANNQAGTTINGQQADLGVTKTIDNATPNVGDTVTFAVTVHNNGPSGATNVALTDQLPTGLIYVSSTASQGAYSNATGIWTVGSLSAAGPTSSATLTVVATVTQAGPMVNTASVSASDQNDPNAANNSGSASLNGSPLANLVVDKSGPAVVTPGNDVVYLVVVTNNGPSDAMNVIVTDPTPAGLTFAGNAGACTTAYPCSMGTIATGTSATIATTYTVPANYTGANPITNTAGVTSDTPDPDNTDNQSSAQTGVGVGNADLSIVKTAPATIASGASITYTLAIANNGPSPANGASYDDNVPVGITAISASCGGTTGGASCITQPVVTGNSVGGTVGSLPSGGGVVITITGTAGSGPMTLTNNARITVPPGVNDPDLTNNNSTVSTGVGATSANLSVQKLGPAIVAPGSNVTYTLTVTNAGPDTAINAVLDDPTPTGLTFVSASIPCATGFPCALGDVASGGSTIVTVTFAVPLDAGGSITNTATIGSDTPDPTPVDNTSTVTTTIVPGATSADLAVVKTGPASIAAGADITYTLQVTNNGPDAATNVVLADDTPPALIFVTATAPCAAGFPCNLGTLATGATTTISVTLSVREGATAPIVNTASATSETPDPDGSNNSSTVTSTVVPVAGASADLVVTKTGPANAAAGATISYTIAVVNHGPDAVPDAVLTDPTPAGLFYVASSAPCTGGFPCALGAIANGESVSVTVSYEVDAAFSGTITNIASANSTTVPDPTPDNNASAVTTTVARTSVDHTLAVPVNARWMLLLLAALLVLVAAPMAVRRR